MDIEFRGRRTENEEFVFGNLIKKGEKYYIQFKFRYKTRPFTPYKDYYKEVEVYPESVGQFINLIDNNNERIYVGDIVRDEFGRELEIVYWRYKFCFRAIGETNFRYTDFYDWLNREDMEKIYKITNNIPIGKLDVEIIGNVYEKRN